MTRRTMPLGTVLIAASALAACDPSEDPFLLHAEDFETVCEGTPCGWVQITGPEDAVLYVETLPGDHGLELVGDGVTVRGSPSEIVPGVYTALAGRMVARCDAGSVLDLRATFELRDGGTVTFDAAFAPPADWSTVLSDATLVSTEGSSPGWALSRLLGLSVRKSGRGSCEVDYLAIRWASFL